MISWIDLGRGIGDALMQQRYLRNDLSEQSSREMHFFLGLDVYGHSRKKSNFPIIGQRATLLNPVITVLGTYTKIIRDITFPTLSSGLLLIEFSNQDSMAVR